MSIYWSLINWGLLNKNNWHSIKHTTLHDLYANKVHSDIFETWTFVNAGFNLKECFFCIYFEQKHYLTLSAHNFMSHPQAVNRCYSHGHVIVLKGSQINTEIQTQHGFTGCMRFCVYTYCVFGHGGQPRWTICICFIFNDVICPHVRVIQTITVPCWRKQRMNKIGQCDNLKPPDLWYRHTQG